MDEEGNKLRRVGFGGPVEGYDAHVHATVVYVFQACGAEEVSEAVGVGEAVYGLGEVGVGGAVVGEEMSEEGDEASDVKVDQRFER